jgi:hypothetical protein
MSAPKHSKSAIKAHPAPDRDDYRPNGDEYAEACRLVNEARTAFDKQGSTKFIGTSPYQRANDKPRPARTKFDTTLTNNARKPQVVRTQALFDAVLKRVADGESLNKICTTDDMPCRETFFAWIRNDNVALQAYDLALAARAEKMAEEIVEIADEFPPCDGETGKIDAAWVSWQKNRMDARKWTSSKLLPKKYGDRTTLAGDSDNPIALLTMEQIALNPKSRLKVG